MRSVDRKLGNVSSETLFIISQWYI